jgi:hypothetical protein
MDVSTAVSEALAQARTLRWDSLYRFLASLVGMAAMAAVVLPSVEKPSDAVREATDWAGLALDEPIANVSAWLSDPARSEAIAVAAVIVFALALFSVAMLADQGYRPGSWRAASTFWLALGVYLETGWSGVALLVQIGAAFAIWTLWKRRANRGLDQEVPVVAVLDLLTALVLAIVGPSAWSMSRPAQAVRHPSGAPKPLDNDDTQ